MTSYPEWERAQLRRRFWIVLGGGGLLAFVLAACLFFGAAYAVTGNWPVRSWPFWLVAAFYGVVRGLAVAGADLEAGRARRDVELWKAIVAGGAFGKPPRGRA